MKGENCIGYVLSKKIGKQNTDELNELIKQYGGREYHFYEIGSIDDVNNESQIANKQGVYNAVYNYDNVDALMEKLKNHILLYQKDKDTFEEMIKDWQDDNAPEYDDLEITEVKRAEKGWIAIANDEKTQYQLSDDGTGNIVINYLGTI